MEKGEGGRKKQKREEREGGKKKEKFSQGIKQHKPCIILKHHVL